MSRSSGTYTAPANSFNPGVEGAEAEEGDFNELLDDLEAALTESVYTAGMGATDNRLVRTDGTDTKKVQGTGITVSDTDAVSGVLSIATTTIELGHATDTTLARSGAGDITVEGNAVYRAGGTDVPITDGGTGASTAAAGARALLEGIGTTQGDLLYRSGTEWTALTTGTSGQYLKSQGAAANPMWDNPAGSGDVTAAAGFGTDNVIIRSDGTGKGVQFTGISVADTSNNVSGVGTLSSGTITTSGSIELGHATDTTVSRASAGDIQIEANIVYRAGGTDVPITDGGTGASTATAAFDALSPLTTQGDIIYRNASNNVRLATGSAGQVLTAGGAGANPSWTTVAGTGDVTAAAAFATDNVLIRSDGTAKGVQFTGISVADTTNDVTGVGTFSSGAITSSGAISNGTSGVTTTGTIELGHASDTTLARSAAAEVTIEGTLIKKVGKETIFIPAAAMVPRTTNGAASGTTELTTNKNMTRTLDFDTTTQEFAQFSVWFPKSWNLGTVTFQPSFSQLTTAAGGVVFGLAGVAVSDGDDLDVAFGTAQTSTKTAGTLNKEYQGPESAAITIAGTPAAADRVMFQINRTVADASDTLAQDARLHGVRLFFTTSASTDV